MPWGDHSSTTELKKQSTPETSPSARRSMVLLEHFDLMEKTFPEFHFKLWEKDTTVPVPSSVTSNGRGGKKKRLRQRRPNTTVASPTRLKPSLAGSRLARALLRPTTATTATTATTTPSTSASHHSPLSMQTRLIKENRVLLHFLDDDDSILLESVRPSLMKHLSEEKRREQILTVNKMKSMKSKKNLGPILKSKKRNMKRKLRKFVKQGQKFQKKFSQLSKQTKQMSDEFNSVKVSKPGEHVAPTKSNVLELDNESSYDKLLEGFDRGRFEDPELLGSGRRLRSRSGSRGSRGSRGSHGSHGSQSLGGGGGGGGGIAISRPVSSQSIRQATTRLTRAKEQLRTVIVNDADMNQGTGMRLFGRPMSRGIKSKLWGNSSGDVGGSGGSSVGATRARGGTFSAVESDAVTTMGVTYKRTVVNSNGTTIMLERRKEPTIHAKWLGLEPG